MKVDVLGCYGASIGNYRTTAFLINDTILLDAGTLTEVLSYEKLKKITSAFITHTHIDHLKGLFPFLDERAALKEDGIKVYAAGPILKIMSQNLFNNLIWPDFMKIPSEEKPIVRPFEIELEREVEVAGVTFKPVLVSHTVYTTGFVVKEGRRGFMFTSDTGETERFWEIAKSEEGIEFIIVDVSFPETRRDIARLSGHMTLSMVLKSLDNYGLSHLPVYIYHIKPFFIEEIKEDLQRSKKENIFILEQGKTIEI